MNRQPQEALEAELGETLGYDKYDRTESESSNSRIRAFRTFLFVASMPKRLFPTDDSVLKSIFLAVDAKVKKWSTRTRDWHTIWGQRAIHFHERLQEANMI